MATASKRTGAWAHSSIGCCLTHVRTKPAPRWQRNAALEAAFNTLGQKAMLDLMTNADVMASIIQLGAYVDQQRFNGLAATPTP
jgi:hypothetical protein